MDHSFTVTWNKPQPDHLISSTGQWINGIFPSAPEICIRARFTGPKWIDELPWVLRGVCTAPKEDLHTSSAELVYSTPLTVLGDFVTAPTTASASTFLLTLCDKVQGFIPVPTSQQGMHSSSVPSDLHRSQYIFFRHDCHQSPLECPCEAPFKVINSGAKAFTISRGGKLETISIDRLKRTHLDFDMPVPTLMLTMKDTSDAALNISNFDLTLLLDAVQENLHQNMEHSILHHTCSSGEGGEGDSCSEAFTPP